MCVTAMAYHGIEQISAEKRYAGVTQAFFA
jgi:hypothetical protein